jgi:hypothetical protein
MILILDLNVVAIVVIQSVPMILIHVRVMNVVQVVLAMEIVLTPVIVDVMINVI